MAMTERDRRALIILGVIAGIAVAFFLVTQVLGGGDEETAAPTPAPVPASGAPEPEPTTASPTPTKSPKEVVNFSGRDPFSTPPELAPSPTVTATTTTSPTSTETTADPETDPAKPADDQSSNVAGKQVTLTTVYTRGGTPRVTVEVEGKVYDEAVGGTFDQNYEVRSIDTTSSCATFVYGDESFRLCSDAPK
ncbi:MAG: hypothetical protein WEA54_02625 [Actinomycetota bacterium]